jgi:hypothetical protein
MLLLPEAAGPHDPVRVTPARPTGSVRRTSSIDTSRPDGIRGDLVMVARARDLLTGAAATPTVVGEAELRLRLDGASRQIRSIASSPNLSGLESLVGSSVGPGFRARLNDALPGEQDSGSLLYLLLDDLPGAALVSGYAMQRAGLLDGPLVTDGAERSTTSTGGDDRPIRLTRAQLPSEDLCAGWAHDAVMMVTIRATGEVPTPMGPPAPTLESDDDPSGWHAMEPLGPHAMRRRRRLDLLADEGRGSARRVDVHFRDSHMDPSGLETVVHEYSLVGSIDSAEGRVVELVARADVLPWMECPGALASAGRLAGMPLAELRPRVRRELTGSSSCTHLNDMLRSLGDVSALSAELDGPAPPPSDRGGSRRG